MRRTAVMMTGLVLLTLAVYWPVYRFGFIDFDDPDYVSSNRHVLQGFNFSGIYYAFTTYTMGNWNPLLWLSFYLDRAMFHIRPGPMHVENVLLHLTAGLLLWWMLTLATGNQIRSFLVAALFLCHPMHVESVAWISERKDVLSTPLLFAAILLYLHYCRQSPGGRRWAAYLLLLVVFVLSLMAKTMGVTLPAVLLLMDYWPLRRWPATSWKTLFAEKIPLFIVSILFAVIGGIAQRVTGATVSIATLGIFARTANALVCYVLYLAKLAVPIHLSVLYVHPKSRPPAPVFAAAVLLVLLTLLVLRFRKRFAYAIVGWLWFLGTLVPVIGLVQLGSQAMADRYSYLPSIGLFILIVWASGDLLQWLRMPAPVRSALAGIVIAAYTVTAHVQAGYWRDSQTLFTHALAVSDDSATAHVVLGNIAIQNKDIHQAIDQMKLALANGRDSAAAYFGLGNCWLIDNPPLACTYFRKAVQLEPRNPLFRQQYAEALKKTADQYPTEKKADLEEALKQVQAGLEIPDEDPAVKDELEKLRIGLAASAAGTSR